MKTIRIAVESLIASRNNMVAAMHQNLNVKTTFKLRDNLEYLTEKD